MRTRRLRHFWQRGTCGALPFFAMLGNGVTRDFATSPMQLLAWSLAIAAALHIFEEFVWPGGFQAWWVAYRPGTAGSVTNGFLIGINTLLMVISVIVAFAVQTPRGNGVAVWLTLAAL